MIDRKPEILRTALEIIATEGYASLTMRALARASDMKLGALQYHFPTWEALLVALAAHVSGQYSRSLEELERATNYQATILDITRWYLTDSAGASLFSASRLWPQLWAMSRVEPAMQEALDNVYRKSVALFESHLTRAGSTAPRIEAIALLSLGEGSLLVAGPGAPFEADSRALGEAILEFVSARYGDAQAPRKAAGD